jgi:uncharacterized protein (TIGR03066 family)
MTLHRSLTADFLITMKRFLFLLVAFCVVAAAPAFSEEQAINSTTLVGKWKYEDETIERLVRYDFRADGTFVAEMQQAGSVARKLDGQWAVEDGMLVMTYKNDSLAQMPPGQQERDRIMRADESSFTIEFPGEHRRTYWRDK